MDLLLESGESPALLCERSQGQTPREKALEVAARYHHESETKQGEIYLKTAAYLQKLERKYCTK
jgi:hypothetical protein